MWYPTSWWTSSRSFTPDRMPRERSRWCIGRLPGETGVKQGCVLSPLLFYCLKDRILREVTEMLGGDLHIKYILAGGLFLSYEDKTTASTCIQDVLYADDLTLVETRKKLQHMLDVLDRACDWWACRLA